MGDTNEGTWPEQQAVHDWKKEHGIELTFEQENQLKKAVSAYRIKLQTKLTQLTEELDKANKELEQLKKGQNK